MDWITEETTASEVVNTCGASIAETIKAVEYWARLKHKKARYEAIDRITNEFGKQQEDWSNVIADIQNLKF